MKKALLILAVSGFAAFALSSETEFRGLDLSKANKLLFSARTELPGKAAYDTLFIADLASGSIEQLSFYPEEICFLDGGASLQVRNRFGVFRADPDTGKVLPVEGFPSFVRGSQIVEGKLLVSRASPDGRYILSIAPTSYAYGRLVLFDVEKGKETQVAEKIEYSPESLPAVWSGDSGRFVYAKGGQLYYYSIDQYKGNRVLDESYRSIGKGSINSAKWGRDGNLYFLSGSRIYRILPTELFTRTLYPGLITVGTIVGKIPFSFDPSFDSFEVSPDGKKLLFNKEGRNIFLFYLIPDDFTESGSTTTLPYLSLPGNTEVLSVLWPRNDMVTIATNTLNGGTPQGGAYRIEVPKQKEGLSLSQKFIKLDLAVPSELELSPDEASVALLDPKGVSVRSYADWSERRFIAFDSPLKVIWKNPQELVIAGAGTMESFDISKEGSSLIALSSAKAYGFSKGSQAISVKTEGKLLERTKDSLWTPLAAYSVEAPSNASDSYRVYLDELSSGSYKNAVMVRAIKGLGTSSLILPPPKTYAVYPAGEEDPTPGIFDHGSRTRRREVSLVFNAIDSSEGIIRILTVLREYGIKASFFLNGEFIRRNPGAVKEIGNSGHEVGSMFYANFNLTDARYRADAEFVKRGLARNEDDYYAVTGKELSLMWHAPFYTVSTEIVAASSSIGYSYVGRDVDPLDWVSDRDAATLPGAYFSANDIVENVMRAKKPGSIIPVRVGIPEGGRNSYFFQELDLLINGLIEEGFDIVPISALIEHSR